MTKLHYKLLLLLTCCSLHVLINSSLEHLLKYWTDYALDVHVRQYHNVFGVEACITVLGGGAAEIGGPEPKTSP